MTSLRKCHFHKKKENSEFIPPLLWPPNVLHLNPLDYSVWGILQDKVYETRMTALDDLKHHIRTEWAKLDHAVIAASVHQWRRRLSGCVRPAAVISSTVFDLDIVYSATTTTFLTVVDQSNTCMQIARSVWFNCS